MKFFFRTKLVNDELYKRNGDEIRIIGFPDRLTYEIEFLKDNTTAVVYVSEVLTEKEYKEEKQHE